MIDWSCLVVACGFKFPHESVSHQNLQQLINIKIHLSLMKQTILTKRLAETDGG